MSDTVTSDRKAWPPAGEPFGLECRRCGCRHLPVDHTRRMKGMIVRYRHCRHCGARVTSCERLTGGRP